MFILESDIYKNILIYKCILKMMSLLKSKNGIVHIIAEIGVNHNGDIDIAKKLIDVAQECNADSVKFQTFKTEKVMKKDAPKAIYQKIDIHDDSSQYDMVKKLELSENDFKELKIYTESKDMLFISTPFDLESVELLNNIGVKIFKVGSGDCDNYLLLKKIIDTGKNIIISTGMTSIDEIKNIKEFLDNNNYNDKYMFLHCISSYPSPCNEMNISCIETMKKILDVPVGFSDHTINDIAAIMSIALGACCIEKHITLDNDMKGPDHKASLNPSNFKKFVESIRISEQMIGDGNKRCMPCEKNTKFVAKKNLVYVKNFNIGNEITYNDIEALRPNNGGISPMYVENIVGKKIRKNVNRGDVVLFSDF